MFTFNNSYAEHPSPFYSKIYSTNHFQPTLLIFNQELAQKLNISIDKIDKENIPKYFSACEWIPGSNPIAMNYAGQQFGHFVPQLGDGRAMLLGEFMTNNNQRIDVHLKGSGPTAYSRNGDGKCALGPAMREYIVSEAMHALGIPTSRTLCIVKTNEMIQREVLQPGAVLTRLALGHIRVGTFQYFAAQNDIKNLKILADYSIERFAPLLNNSINPYFEFWKEICQKQISLVNQWMSVGFIHGVMNTDNVSISGETLDYGPCAFMDHFSYHKVFSSIDVKGRYSYSNQINIIIWNLARLAECFIPLLQEQTEVATKMFGHELELFHKKILQDFHHTICKKLGLSKFEPDDNILINSWFELLESNKCDFTLGHIDIEKILQKQKTFTNLETFPEFDKFYILLRNRLEEENRPLSDVLDQLSKINPMTIPRNHQIEKAIQSSIKKNDQDFFELLNALKSPYVRLEKLTEYQLPPTKEQKILKTFCGT